MLQRRALTLPSPFGWRPRRATGRTRFIPQAPVALPAPLPRRARAKAVPLKERLLLPGAMIVFAVAIVATHWFRGLPFTSTPYRDPGDTTVARPVVPGAWREIRHYADLGRGAPAVEAEPAPVAEDLVEPPSVPIATVSLNDHSAAAARPSPEARGSSWWIEMAADSIRGMPWTGEPNAPVPATATSSRVNADAAQAEPAQPLPDLKLLDELATTALAVPNAAAATTLSAPTLSPAGAITPAAAAPVVEPPVAPEAMMEAREALPPLPIRKPAWIVEAARRRAQETERSARASKVVNRPRTAAETKPQEPPTPAKKAPVHGHDDLFRQAP